MHIKEINSGKRHLAGMKYRDFREWVISSLGLKSFRADQIFTWIHQKGAVSFDEMTNIGKSTRSLLSEKAVITTLEPGKTLSGEDGTVKYSFLLQDNKTIESVLIPDPPRLTACLSTQAGCKMGCLFCQTGLTGFRRNLRSGEIVEQLYHMRRSAEERISNVVLMGMGEPLDNFDSVADALSIISEDQGICIGTRKITVSTVGLPGGIKKLANLDGQYGLAVSLHSAIQSTRREIVPAATALPIERLRNDILYYASVTGRRVTLEYCLIADVNDSIKEAEALVDFARGIPCKINIFFYNPVKGMHFERPDENTVSRFVNYLYPRCPAVTLRKSRGTDIAAACGQLGGRRDGVNFVN